ncbi:MAG: hypothetical protein QOH17_2602, partial [Pseudonocardiales bacterium]|nr:hypothetical protein [Pseudonocardiales bacterium]
GAYGGWATGRAGGALGRWGVPGPAGWGA